VIARCLKACVSFFTVCCELGQVVRRHWSRGTTSASPLTMFLGIAAASAQVTSSLAALSTIVNDGSFVGGVHFERRGP
jgi:hypothetical protein